MVRDPLKGWMLIGNATGQVYVLTKDSVWERQDSTEAIGYNCDAYLLPGPCKYGGYGIWKSNGMFLFYSWVAHEWETIQLSREIPTGDRANCFYSSIDSILYQVGAHPMNAGIKTENYYVDSVYALDLKTGNWNVLGAISSQFKKHIGGLQDLGVSFSSEHGLLFRVNTSRKFAYVDLTKLQVSMLDDSKVLRMLTLDKTAYSEAKTLFSTAYGIYSMHPTSYELIDSISWDELLSKPMAVVPLLEPNSNVGINWKTWGGFGTVFLLISGMWYSKRRRSKGNSTAIPHLKVVTDSVDTAIVTETENIVQALEGRVFFNGIAMDTLTTKENQLLLVLIDCRKDNSVLTTQHINELLGIDQRSLDAQKKIRSELIRSINRSFQERGFSGEAIERSRQEDDRRSVGYELSKEIQLR